MPSIFVYIEGQTCFGEFCAHKCEGQNYGARNQIAIGVKEKSVAARDVPFGHARCRTV